MYVWRREGGGWGSRCWVDLVQEAAAVALVEHACEAPWLVLEWLDVHYLDEEDIAGLCALDLKRAREIMDFCQIYIPHVICGIIVPDLAAGPSHHRCVRCNALFHTEKA